MRNQFTQEERDEMKQVGKFMKMVELYKNGKYEEFNKKVGKLSEDEFGAFEMFCDVQVELGGTYEVADQAKNAWLNANW